MADAGTVELLTGLQVIDSVNFAAKSFTSTLPNISINLLSAGTASNEVRNPRTSSRWPLMANSRVVASSW